MESYRIRIAKDDLAFSAAHFITFGQGECERLHGHDYRVAVEVHGPLGENHYVLDFLVLRDVLRDLLSELDHRVLLPSEHPTMRVETHGEEVTVTLATRRWIFPAEDCQLLPLANTTCELLARYLGERLREELATRHGLRPTSVQVEIAEGSGFSATCQLDD